MAMDMAMDMDTVMATVLHTLHIIQMMKKEEILSLKKLRINLRVENN